METNITRAEDTRTQMAKNDLINNKRVAIDTAHTTVIKSAPSLMQQGRNLSYNMGTTIRKAIQHVKYDNQHVQFDTNNRVTTFFNDDATAMIT